MPSLPAALAIVPLLTALAAPPQPACTDQAQSLWLQGCMSAVSGAQQAERGPADGDTQKVFVAERDLAVSFVRLCEEKARQGLSKDGWPPAADGCSTEERVEWLGACEKDAKAIVPGSPRSAIQSRFTEEAGFTAMNRNNFVHPRCPMLHIDVLFANGMVRTVSMYIGYTAFD